MTSTHYQTLGVDNFATRDEIKQRYRDFCLCSHPDKVKFKDPRLEKKNNHLFWEVTTAYKYLMANKEVYDNLLRQSDVAHYRAKLVELSPSEDELLKTEAT